MATEATNTQKLVENQLDDSIYEDVNWGKFKVIFIFLSLTLLFFILNFPLKTTIKTLLDRQISAIPGHPITYSEMNFSLFFFPTVEIASANVKGSAFNSFSDLKFNHISISLVRPSIFPPGVRLHVEGISKKSHFNIRPTLSPFGHRLRIEDTSIGEDVLTPILGGKIKLRGNFQSEIMGNYKTNKFYDGDFLITSKNFALPAQTISALALPTLSIGHFHLEGEADDDGVIKITKLEIGKEKSPISAKMEGTIYPSPKGFSESKLALNAQIRFSNEFLENFAIIKLFLGEKKANNGFYSMKIQGKLSSPTPLLQ